MALKPIAAEYDNVRSVPVLSYSLTWFGSAAGGIAMGRIAERTGVRWTVMFGALMVAAGLFLSSVGGRASLYIGHGVLVGVLGNAGINAPLYVYVARWFDRRRGTALALIASGQAVAGTIWAPLFGHAIQAFGWCCTMQLYAVFAIVTILPTACIDRASRVKQRRQTNYIPPGRHYARWFFWELRPCREGFLSEPLSSSRISGDN